MWALALCFAGFVAAWVFLDARDRGLSLKASLAWAAGHIVPAVVLLLVWVYAARAAADAVIALGVALLPVFFLLVYVYVQQGKAPYEKRPSIAQKNNAIVALLCVFGVFIVNEMTLIGGGKLAPAYAIFLGLFLVNLPFLLGGVIVSAIIRRCISSETIQRRMQGGITVLAWSILGGLVLPLGQCGAAPIARRLMRKGASPLCGMLTITLFPVLNSVLLLRLWHVTADAILVGATVAFALLAGVITAALVPLSLQKETPAEEGGFDEEELPGFSGFCHGVVTEFLEFAKYLGAGAFLASLMAAMISNTVLAAWMGSPATQLASGMVKGVLSPVTYLSIPEMAAYLRPLYAGWEPLSVFIIVATGYSVTHFAVVYGALKTRAAGLYLAVMSLCIFLFGLIAGLLAIGGAN